VRIGELLTPVCAAGSIVTGVAGTVLNAPLAALGGLAGGFVR
jgi:hypothetical protein